MSSSRPTIGVFTPYLDGPYEKLFLKGVIEESERQDARVTVFVGGQLHGESRDEQNFNTCYGLAGPESVDALIVPVDFMCKMLDPIRLEEFIAGFRSRMPVVCTGRSVPGVPSVVSDHAAALRSLLEHLITTHACRRVGLVSNEYKRDTFLPVYREVLCELGCEFRKELTSFTGWDDRDGGASAFSALLGGCGEPPDAIVATSALFAGGIIRELHARGVRISDNMRIAALSIDTYDWPVTMAVEDLAGLGAEALRIALRQVRHEPSAEATCIPYSAGLFIRQSCGCVATAHPRSECASGDRECIDRRSECVDVCLRIVESLGAVPRNGRGLLEDLYSGMASALATDGEGDFFSALGTLIHSAGVERNGPFALANVLFAMHENLSSDLKARVCGSELLARAQSYILSELFSIDREFDYLDYTVLNHHIHVSLLNLASVTSVDQVREPLGQLVKNVGLGSLSVNLYRYGVASSDGESEEVARHGVEFVEREPSSFPRTFTTALLAPGGIRTATDESALVVLPLFAENPLGFVVTSFRLSTMHLYRRIREQLSSTLANLHLFQSLQRHTQSIEFMNHQLKAEIERRQALQLELIQSNKMEAVGRLAGGIAHDFNNLLTIILGNCSYLDALELGTPMVKERLGASIDAAQMAANLTRRLLAFSKKQVLDMSVYDLNSILRELHPLLKSSLGGHCEVRLGYSVEPATIRADKTQIEQVLLNLAANARDAMPSGGTFEVLVSTAVDGTTPGRVILTVADTGCGMDSQTRQKVFEPFFTTKPRDRGTGLGLATVYGIVQQSGGTIQVESEPGKGSRFIINLPRVSPAERTDPESEEKPAPRVDRSKYTVLVVDDEPSVRLVAVEILREQGYRVLDAADGQAAETLANLEKTLDLVATDVLMPMGQGPEVVARIRLKHPDVKALYISGFSDDLDLCRDKRDSFLPKPFSYEVLVEKVNGIIDAA